MAHVAKRLSFGDVSVTLAQLAQHDQTSDATIKLSEIARYDLGTVNLLTTTRLMLKFETVRRTSLSCPLQSTQGSRGADKVGAGQGGWSARCCLAAARRDRGS